MPPSRLTATRESVGLIAIVRLCYPELRIRVLIISGDMSTQCLFGFGDLDENSQAEGVPGSDAFENASLPECPYRWRKRAGIV